MPIVIEGLGLKTKIREEGKACIFMNRNGNQSSFAAALQQ